MSSSMPATDSRLKSSITPTAEAAAAGSSSDSMPTPGISSSSSIESRPVAPRRPLKSSSAGIFLPFRSPMPSAKVNLPTMLSPSFLPTLSISAMPDI
ncbi:hypothetical protein D3C87_2018810 [compost metagenome]